MVRKNSSVKKIALPLFLELLQSISKRLTVYYLQGNPSNLYDRPLFSTVGVGLKLLCTPY